VFSKVTPALVDRLRAIVGAGNVELDDLEPYSHDYTEDFRFPPEVAVRPRTTEEVARVVRLANDALVPVTAQGGRTSLSGGALCVHGGIALSLERMNRIVEVDAENLFAVVEPAVITQALQEEVEKRGLFYGPDPASRGSCTLGGNVAHCAGGPRALKYGVTKDWVTGLVAVLPSGEVIRTGGKLMKNVTGYNLTQLLVGSEGTLAVVTEITLKLIPLPKFRRTMLAPFPDLVSAARAVTRIFDARIVPCCVEFMDRAAVEAAEKRKAASFPAKGAATLLVEVDGNDEALLEREAERVGEACVAEGAPDVFLAMDEEQRRFIWDLRRSIGEAVKSLAPYKEEDTVVPRARLPELVAAVEEVSRRHGLTAVSYGHVGDGNLHVNILKLGVTEEEWRTRVPAAVREIFERTLALGGQITGEHGVGYVQREFLPMAYPEHQIELMRELKRVFDPKGILNPGKILPDGSERRPFGRRG
jgi:glycolate oxidase